MKKLIINGHTFYYEKSTGLLFVDRMRKTQIGKSAYTETQLRDAIDLADQQDGRKLNGGTRDNAGRKPRTSEGQSNRGVYLTDSEHNYLVWKHGSFTGAVRSLLPMGWEFEEN